jgi:hypothetical protein
VMGAPLETVTVNAPAARLPVMREFVRKANPAIMRRERKDSLP